MFRREDLIAIEKHIKDCKDDVIAIAADTQDQSYLEMAYGCKCGINIKRDINKGKPIDRVKVTCPDCRVEKGTVIINLIDA